MNSKSPKPPDAGVGPRLPFPVVGIGASAGGLEACTALLKALPADLEMAFVVVQHLDPHHQSLLRELLSRATRMAVTQAEDGIALEPHHVYVIPPDRDVTLRRGALRLSSREQAAKHMPVDRFLKSLAEDQAGGAIGIILSGTGSDGTAGLEAVKAEGGIAFAQDPKSASYPGMPESAIAAGCVDFVLPPAAMARELLRLSRSPAPATGEPEPVEGSESLVRILHALRSATGVDFSLYKPGTIRRRVARRMVVQKAKSLEQYASDIERNPAEAQALGQDLLIHVTSFFREPQAFAALRRNVFPKLLASGSQGEPIRIWVPGCSTGEEVYSIAIALLEFLDHRADDTRCQIFATDISTSALDRARLGTYSEAAVAGVSPKRLARFFAKVGANYRIDKAVRDRCVFARHDLGQDPPFSRLDLISCRNVLIYMGPILQKRVLSIFHYALRPSGFLMLGESETIGPSARLFSLVERKNKVYSPNPVPAAMPSGLAARDRGETPARESARAETDAVPELQKAVERLVWQRHELAALVVDADLHVIHFQGNTGSYLQPATGAASLHLFKLVRQGLVLDLRAALHKAKKEKVPVRREGIRLDHESGSETVDVEVVPINGRRAKWPDFLILIEQAGRKGSGKPSRARDAEQFAVLSHELASTREQLQSIIESQEATNEELETAKEELQSSNEELTTLNEELQNRNAELGQLADDLSNLLVGVDIPIVILGADRRIRRFTPAAEKLLNLIPGDVGRPISDLKPNINAPELDRLISEVIDKASPVERDVQGRDGRWYSLRMRPHTTAGNRTAGVLMALLDIDVMKRGLELVRLSRDEAVAARDLSAALLDLSGALIVVRHPDGTITGFNAACQETSGFSFEEVKNRRLGDFLLAPEEVDESENVFAALRDGVETAARYENCWIRKDGSRRVIAWSSLAHHAADGSVIHIISTGLDITARKMAEDALRQSQEELRRLTASLFTTQEEERKRLARELHDDMNQRMAMLANEVNLLERDLPGSPDLVRDQLRSLRERVEQLSDDLRRAAHQLHPSSLEHFGLVAALDAYCPDFSKLYPIRLKFTHRGVPASIPFDVSLCLYRVAQECLHNIAKHSGANEATLALRGDKKGLVLSVIDKGEGFDPDLLPDQKGLGIVGIRERVRLVGGSVSIQSRAGHGTEIDVRVPLNRVAS
ncbi:MAG TPA: chemotaxis protein CheB [Bryobacteraceae bacterium]|nr:chemotaxis protein CheB [Bryobacteraceae bacterium]